MLFNLSNSAFIVLGGLIGAFLTRGVPEKIKNSIIKAMGICVIYIGISLAIEGDNVLLVVMSIAAGTLIGELLDIDDKINKIGVRIQAKFSSDKKGKSKFAEGFVTASILFCAGAMGVVGALNVGLTGNGDTLVVKGMIDGVFAALFATAFGFGVLFSSIPVFIYQAFFIALAGYLSKYLGPDVIASVSGVGGITIIGIGLNLTLNTDIKVANMAPGIFIPMILSLIGII